MSDVPDPVRGRLISAGVFLAGAVALVVIGLVVRGWERQATEGPDPDIVPRVTAHAPGEGPVPPFTVEAECRDVAVRTVVQGEYTTHELRCTSPLPPDAVLALYPEGAAEAEAAEGGSRVILRWPQ